MGQRACRLHVLGVAGKFRAKADSVATDGKATVAVSTSSLVRLQLLPMALPLHKATAAAKTVTVTVTLTMA